jgi:hypothetical protein
MFSGIPIIRFGMTDGRNTNFFINDRPSGAMHRSGGRSVPMTTVV